MNCPNCGHATPPAEAARCGHCNFKLPASIRPQAAQPDTILPCWNCCHPNTAEAERCERCNAKILAHSAAPFASRKPAIASTRKPVNVSNHDE